MSVGILNKHYETVMISIEIEDTTRVMESFSVTLDNQLEGDKRIYRKVGSGLTIDVASKLAHELADSKNPFQGIL